MDIALRYGGNICETGFFKGVSAHLWLHSTDVNNDFSNRRYVHRPPLRGSSGSHKGGNKVRDAALYSFDQRFEPSMVEALRESFGAHRLKIYAGSTRDTLGSGSGGNGGSTRDTLGSGTNDNKPAFTQAEFGERKRDGGVCDIIHVDGGHSGWDPYLDYVELKKFATCDTIVLFDDTFARNNDNVGSSEESGGGQSGDAEDNPHRYKWGACSKSYWRAVDEGLLDHVQCWDFGLAEEGSIYPKGFCMGRPACTAALVLGSGAVRNSV